MAIDFGQAKVGLAMADTETRIAFVYGVLQNDRNFWKNLEKIIEKEGVSQVVIGRTNYIHAVVETRLIASVRKLGENLKKIGVAVEFAEEMFSTKMAQANLKEKGAKRVGKIDDAEAARLILQSWLDKMESLNSKD